MTSKVMECGVASSDGTVGCGATGLSLCDVKCLEDSSCQELTALSCLGTPTQDLIDCLAGCSALDLSCDDGGTAYAEGDRCDGQAVCDDGADEAGCARFTCDDGEAIALGLVCDSTPDCADESDEVGCQPLTSTCPGGGEGGAGSAGDAGSGGESGDASGGEGGSADAPNLVASPTESCDRISQRLAACDPSDDFYFHCYGDTVTYDKCLADCMEAASCDDVLASACDLSTDNAVYD
jgi:hypothetical protein